MSETAVWTSETSEVAAMPIVYALSAKGYLEKFADQPQLPVELTQLLRLIDGRRTAAELLAAIVGRPALKAYGLRWLEAAGYVTTTIAPDLPAPGQPASMASALDGAPETWPPSSLLKAAPAPMRVRDDGAVARILANFMMETIQRWLGENGYSGQSQIERATRVQDLLPHLNPLVDAIVTQAGADTGAEFASTAAFILNPNERDGDSDDDTTLDATLI